MHTFKRIYLLFGLITSASIPFITFTQYVDSSTNSNQIAQNIVPVFPETQIIDLSDVFWSLYLLGVVIFGIRFIINIIHIQQKIRHNPQRLSNSFTNVLLRDMIAPHTFFNYIFFNKEKYEANEIPKEVFWHEQTHAKQKHSIDVLFMELLQVIFWFNPLLYIFKHAIKLNHEFLADQGVLNKGINTKYYQETLLAFSSNADHPKLVNAINYSLIKKRFTVMKTKTTRRQIWLKSFVLLPLLAISLFSFSSKKIVEVDNSINNTIETIKSEEPNLVLNEYKVLQEGATTEQVATYNQLAKKYNNMPEDKMIIRKNELRKLKELYHLMSDVQKKNAEPFPNIPPPPAPVNIKVKEAPAPPPTPVSIKVIGAPKPNSPPPPPPAPANATKAQKNKYKKEQEKYRVEVNEAKIRKDERKLARVQVINDKKALLIEERKAYRVAETRAAKLINEERKLIRVKEANIKKTQLIEERKVYRIAETRAAKLRNDERKLTRVKEIDDRKTKIIAEQKVYRKAHEAARVRQFQEQKREMKRVREISKEEKTKIIIEKQARKEAMVARKIELKKQKKELIKIREFKAKQKAQLELEKKAKKEKEQRDKKN